MTNTTTFTLAIVSLITSGLAIIAIVVYLCYSNLVIKKEINTPRTTILNTFPSELNSYSKSTLVLSTIATILSILGFTSFFATLIYSGYNDGVGNYSIKAASYFLMVLLIVNALSMEFTGLIDYKKSVKLPIILNTMFIVTTIAIGVFLPLIVLDETTDGLYSMNQIVAWVGFGIFFVSALPMFNPKLKDWYKLEKTEIDGTTIYVRPKINWLASYIWLSYIVVALYHLLLIINSIIMVVQ